MKDRNFKDEHTLEMTADEFRDTGALWYINQQLHLFGMAIAYIPNENKLIPLKTRFRGFNENTNDNGYKQLSRYLKNNITELEREYDGND